jgi:hypothetical protein
VLPTGQPGELLICAFDLFINVRELLVDARDQGFARLIDVRRGTHGCPGPIIANFLPPSFPILL